jgi:hypothetical protein
MWPNDNPELEGEIAGGSKGSYENSCNRCHMVSNTDGDILQWSLSGSNTDYGYNNISWHSLSHFSDFSGSIGQLDADYPSGF